MLILLGVGERRNTFGCESVKRDASALKQTGGENIYIQKDTPK
jgi:hypothetical protein